MLVPLYEPPPMVDSTNVAEFRSRIIELITRYGAVVVDCSQVDLIGPSGMRVLRVVSRDASVTLVNPRPGMQLMAVAYGFDFDPSSEQARVSQLPRKTGAAQLAGVCSMSRKRRLDG